MQKKFLMFIMACALMLGALTLSPFKKAHASDNFTQGMALFKAKKYQEAAPLLEKAANEGHEEAMEALDKIYENEKTIDDTKLQKKQKVAVEETEEAKEERERQALMKKYNAQKLQLAEDPKEVEERDFKRKVYFLGTAVILIFIWIAQKLIMRKMKNAHQLRMEIEAAKAKKEAEEREKENSAKNNEEKSD